jgi:hypothetical protein
VWIRRLPALRAGRRADDADRRLLHDDLALARVVVGDEAERHQLVGEDLAHDGRVDVEADQHPDVAAFT